MATLGRFRRGVLVAVVAIGAAGCERSRTAAEGRAPVPRSAIGSDAVGPVPGAGEPPTRSNPLADDPSALQEGRRLFVAMNCAGCHGGHGGGGMGPSLRDPTWLYGKTPGDVFDSIAQGRGRGMPAWGARLTERQVWELARYIESLGKPDEPERAR